MDQSKKQVKILLMRHAESTYNVMQSDWKKENGLPVDHPENEERRFIKTPELVDAILTDLGIEQSKNAQEVINKYPGIEYVYSSPMRRAVFTAKICMETYPYI
jgi:broad specificity phosphatase PhoE